MIVTSRQVFAFPSEQVRIRDLRLVTLSQAYEQWCVPQNQLRHNKQVRDQL